MGYFYWQIKTMLLKKNRLKKTEINAFLSLIFCCMLAFYTFSRTSTDTISDKQTINSVFESVSVKGYMQIRYNDLYNSQPSIPSPEGEGFVLKTLNISVSSRIHERLFVFFQPDFAGGIGENKHVARLSDAYSDIYLDKNDVFRLRVGLSRVPFGYEHLQSGKHRLGLETSEACTNTWSNGRDLGMLLVWTPANRQEIFQTISTMKGTGDYGVFAIGLVNGRQTNTTDNNKNKHLIARFCYPFYLKKQLIEASVQAYIGKIRLSEKNLTNMVKTNSQQEYEDKRVASTLSIYTNPIGVRAEYTVGKSARFNAMTDSIELANLYGGYLLVNTQLSMGRQRIYPFIQYSYYSGGRQHARDAQNIHLTNWECGIEWHLNKHIELTVIYSDKAQTSDDTSMKNHRINQKCVRMQIQTHF